MPNKHALLAIIGAGQIGSRHLQSLAMLDRPATIVVIDPSRESLQRASQRFAEIQPRNAGVRTIFTDAVGELPSELDVAIVATSADTRLEVMERLLAQSCVRHLVLEKVLFQSASDLRAAGSMLRDAGVTTWVNCPCRIWPHYVSLKRSLDGGRILGLRMVGVNWGIGCNSIHMLDLVAFINGTTTCAVDASCLDPEPVPAKRPGFLEFTGGLTARFFDGCAVNLVSYRSGNVPSVVEIDTESSRHIFDESLGTALELRSNGTERKTRIDVPLQSTLTSLVVHDLLNTGSCGLTPFDQSAELHLPLLQALLEHLRRIPSYSGIERCPIT